MRLMCPLKWAQSLRTSLIRKKKNLKKTDTRIFNHTNKEKKTIPSPRLLSLARPGSTLREWTYFKSLYWEICVGILEMSSTSSAMVLPRSINMYPFWKISTSTTRPLSHSRNMRKMSFIWHRSLTARRLSPTRKRWRTLRMWTFHLASEEPGLSLMFFAKRPRERWREWSQLRASLVCSWCSLSKLRVKDHLWQRNLK